jgi:hypothetical protein
MLYYKQDFFIKEPNILKKAAKSTPRKDLCRRGKKRNGKKFITKQKKE